MTNTLLEMHAIVPEKDVFKSRRISMMVLNEMKQVGKWMKLDLESTAQFWKHKPDFANQLRYKGGDPIIRVGLVGDSVGNHHWIRVNSGTHYVPWTFLPEYYPMTSVPGEFGNNIPRTTLMPYKIYNRKSRKRIHARNWIGTPENPGKLETKYESTFQEAVDFAVRRGLGEI